MHQAVFLGTLYNFIWFCTHCRELNSVAQGKIQWPSLKEQKCMSLSTSYHKWERNRAKSRCLWVEVHGKQWNIWDLFVLLMEKKNRYMQNNHLQPFQISNYWFASCMLSISREALDRHLNICSTHYNQAFSTTYRIFTDYGLALPVRAELLPMQTPHPMSWWTKQHCLFKIKKIKKKAVLSWQRAFRTSRSRDYLRRKNPAKAVLPLQSF